jgi:hypothetical protein
MRAAIYPRGAKWAELLLLKTHSDSYSEKPFA